MILLVFFVLIGILIGSFLPFHFPISWGKYVSVAFLAALDSVLGAGKSVFEERFNVVFFISGFFANTFLAGLLTYFGDLLGVDLYVAAVVTFGVRIFQDLSIIRMYIFRQVKPSSKSDLHSS